MTESPVTASDQLQPVARFARRMFRFWWVGLVVVALGILGTAAFAKYRPKQYRSEAVLHYREGLQWNPAEGMATRRIGQRLKDTILARSLLTKVIEELGLYPKLVKAGRTGAAVEEMLLATSFRFSEGDSFIIAFTGDSPEEAQRVTAKLTEMLTQENTRFRAGQAEVASEFLDAEKKRTGQELAAKEAELARFLAQHPEFAAERTTGAVGARARSRTQDDGQTLAALEREESRLRQQAASAPATASAQQEAALAAASAADARLRAAQRELADRQARLTEEHPDVRSAAALVKEAEAALRRANEAVTASGSTVPTADPNQRLSQLQSEIATYRRGSRSGRPGGEPAYTPQQAQRVVALETEYARLNREASEARERFQQLESRQFMASMTASTLTSGQAAQIVVIDPAYLPANPVGMRKVRLYGLGGALSLVLALGAMAALALLDDRIYDSVDVKRLRAVGVLAEIHRGGKGAARPPADKGDTSRKELPTGRSLAEVTRFRPEGAAGTARRQGALPPAMVVASSSSTVSALAKRTADPGEDVAGGEPAVAAIGGAGRVRVHERVGAADPDPSVVLLSAPDSTAAAEFRILRHRIADRGSPRVVLVTSPRPGEGKTWCAANLAVAMAEGDRGHVLLLEANFRGPSLSRLLGIQPPISLEKQLEFYRAMRLHSWDVAETASPRLHAMTIAPNAGETQPLDGPSLAACVADLGAAGYNRMIVDGPSILGSADANVVEETVDGVLIVLHAGTSRLRDLRKAIEQIGAPNVLGAVLVRT